MSNSTTSAKVNKGDTVRCELDMDAGTLRTLINGVDTGGSFTGLQVRAGRCYCPHPTHPSTSTVRTCTLHVAGNFRGTKYGQRCSFIRQAAWCAC